MKEKAAAEKAAAKKAEKTKSTAKKKPRRESKKSPTLTNHSPFQLKLRVSMMICMMICQFYPGLRDNLKNQRDTFMSQKKQPPLLTSMTNRLFVRFVQAERPRVQYEYQC
ncbi:uncharacterized protein LOC134257815 [Saccostrea cucullata]|uniref:uncharacterized protein LOC134257815 n=1 Tax=Saccostrea cuccullata TaxID=36930 RepID=UPI002ED5EC45